MTAVAPVSLPLPWPFAAMTVARRRLPLLLAGGDPPDSPPERPHDRQECRYGPRPCPWVGCRYSLYLEVTRRGAIKLAFPWRAPDEMSPGESCALDVADRGEHSVALLSPMLGVTKERVRQVEVSAKRQMRTLLEKENETMAAKKKAGKGHSKENGAATGARFSQAAMASTTYRPTTKGGDPRKDAIFRRLYKTEAPVRIAPEELQKKSDALAKVIQDEEAVLEEKRAGNAKYRERLSFFRERRLELAESVTSHTEIRKVECAEFLLERTGEIVTIRQDTGEQVGEARAATADDRQDKLALDDEGDRDDPPGAAEAAASMFDDDDTIPASKLRGDQGKADDARAGDRG